MKRQQTRPPPKTVSRHMAICSILLIPSLSNKPRCPVNFGDLAKPGHSKLVTTISSRPYISLITIISATSLILSRFAQDDEASTSLTLDLFSPNQHSRRKAKQALDLFDNLGGADLYPLRDSAVSTLHDKADPTTQIMCRAFLRASRRFRQGRISSLRELVDAIEDSTYLGVPPPRFPDSYFAFPAEDTRLAVHFQPVSQRVESLVDLLAEQAVAVRPPIGFGSPDEQPDVSSLSSAGLEVPGLEEIDGFEDGIAPARARFHGESNREAEARRRRREAMVLHEGGGVIGSRDIIHPRTDRGI